MNLLVVQQGPVKLMGAGQDLHQLVLVSCVLCLSPPHSSLSAAVVVSITGSDVQEAGEQYTLTCTVSGGSATTTSFRWLRNGVAQPGEISATLSFTPLRATSPSSNGQYTCEAMRSGSTMPFLSEVFQIMVTGKL